MTASCVTLITHIPGIARLPSHLLDADVIYRLEQPYYTPETLRYCACVASMISAICFGASCYDSGVVADEIRRPLQARMYLQVSYGLCFQARTWFDIVAYY